MKNKTFSLEDRIKDMAINLKEIERKSPLNMCIFKYLNNSKDCIQFLAPDYFMENFFQWKITDVTFS